MKDEGNIQVMDGRRNYIVKLSNNYRLFLGYILASNNYGLQIKETLPCNLFSPCLLVIHAISYILYNIGDSRRSKR